jgi:hypothetical protein
VGRFGITPAARFRCIHRIGGECHGSILCHGAGDANANREPLDRLQRERVVAHASAAADLCGFVGRTRRGLCPITISKTAEARVPAPLGEWPYFWAGG